jgi:hypothetical protein
VRTTAPRARTAALLAALALALAACGGSTDDTVIDEPSPAVDVVAEPPAPPSPTSPSTSEDVEPSDEPTTAALDPATACGPEDYGITVTAPADGASVTDGVLLEGCGSTFEANYQWEVVYADGSPIDAGFGTMTCGNGCIGTFSGPLELTGSGPATLTVYETSAEDGSRDNAVLRALDVG